MTGNFSSLEGIFDDPTKPLGFSKEERRAAAERKYLEALLAGTQYAPEDVIGIALGTTHPLEGSEIHHIFLTLRGLKEAQDRALAADYTLLFKRLRCEPTPGTLYDQIHDGKIGKYSCLVGSANPTEYVALGGKDKRKRVLIVNSCNEENDERGKKSGQ